MNSNTATPPTAPVAAQSWLKQLSGLPAGAEQVLRQAHEQVTTLATEQDMAIEPLLAHARGVVGILASLDMDADPLVAAFFCNIPPAILPVETLQSVFGTEIAELVSGVHKLRIVDEYQARPQNKEEERQHLEGLRKLLLGMAQDVRVVLIKLAERVQIMRELKTMPEETRRRVARETKDIFAPLANRLGIWQLKWELEDLSFRFLEPREYQRIAAMLDERRVDRERYIAAVMDELRAVLQHAGIDSEVAGRPKHIYSIWRKMKGKAVDFHNLFDVRAVRVLVPDVAACYAVLGIVHSRWQPISSEFDDYIASPKENRYQSLHTAVIGPESKTLEIQIRTHEMHDHSEHGVAAHWGYKEGGRQDDDYREKIAWLRQILEWKEEERDTADFIDRFKSEVFEDRVYVLTPQGKVVDLPRGAMPLDFAYHIHTDVGHGYRGAKVDGRIVPLGYVLQNGQQVEILTSKQGGPSRDWLNPHLGYLKSSRARAKVRAWFRQQDFSHNVADGRSLMERELRRLGISDVNMEQMARRFRFETADTFFAAVGCGDITSAQIAGALHERILPVADRQVPRPRRRSDRHDDDIRIMGVGDLMTHMARCCKPVPDEAIVGYITRGRGVTIHRCDCRNLLRLQMTENERLVEVEWGHTANHTYAVDIQVRAFDRQGLLRDLTEVLSDDGLNVIAVNTVTDRKTHIASMTLNIEVHDSTQLSRALTRISQLPNVMAAVRRQT
jgi:GTP pyrophosphokinase